MKVEVVREELPPPPPSPATGITIELSLYEADYITQFARQRTGSSVADTLISKIKEAYRAR